MTATVTTTSSYLRQTCTDAARHVHEQEIALHDARQTHIVEWINRAENRLHDALTEYETAMTLAHTATTLAHAPTAQAR